jgi:hypothetical protein
VIGLTDVIGLAEVGRGADEMGLEEVVAAMLSGR